MGGVVLVDGGDGGTGYWWCSGWRLLARNHAGLPVAAAGVEKEMTQPADEPGPIGSLQRLGILFPSSHLHFVIWPSFFSSFFTRRSSHFFI